jgi:hypothetical protein
MIAIEIKKIRGKLRFFLLKDEIEPLKYWMMELKKKH